MIPSRVKSIIGITEPELVKLDPVDRLQYIKGDSFVHSIDKHETNIGEFQTVKLIDLKILVGKNRDNLNKCCPLEVHEGIDIGVLQSDLQTSDEALIQVASNFNCLEVPSRRFYPDCGRLVTNASTDCTQGPGATFGPLSAYLYRAHFYEGGQTRLKQINLLRNVESYFGKPVNGKLTLYGDEKEIYDLDSVADQVEVGLHTNVPVIFGRDKYDTNYELDEPYPFIDQIFNSSINLKDYGKKTSNSNLLKITRTLLRVAYESAYLSAIYRQRKILYLTLIGGGMFHNPIPMILEELVRAHKLWANHQDSKLTKVVICIYEENTNISNKIEKLNI